MKKKKIIMFVMTLVMVLFFASCNDDPEEVEHYIIIESNNGENLKVRNDICVFFRITSSLLSAPNLLTPIELKHYIDILI